MTTLFPTAEQESKCYDNTRISAYKTCPRSYFLRHIMHWRPEGTGLALIFGLSWHDAQDIVWGYSQKFKPADLAEVAFLAFEKTWTANNLPAELTLDQIQYWAPRTPQIARQMLHNYTTDKARQKMMQEGEIISIEQPFAVPMPGEGMEGHWYIGRLDKAIQYQSKKLVVEHKTTTAYATVGNFRTDYVDSWFMSAQVKGYEFGGNLFYDNIDAVWVDAALVHKKIHDAFKFIPVSHNAVLLQEWIENTHRWISEISREEELFKTEGRLLPGMFRKNEESCFGKFGPCPFIDICRTIADPSELPDTPPGFVHEKWEPFSILGLDKIVKGEANEAPACTST